MYPLLSIYSPSNLRSLARDRSGATSIENSLLGALIAVAIIAAVSELGSMVYQIYDLTAQTIEQTTCGPGNGNGNCGNSGNGGANNWCNESRKTNDGGNNDKKYENGCSEPNWLRPGLPS